VAPGDFNCELNGLVPLYRALFSPADRLMDTEKCKESITATLCGSQNVLPDPYTRFIGLRAWPFGSDIWMQFQQYDEQMRDTLACRLV
jgi:hypothetical protein